MQPHESDRRCPSDGTVGSAPESPELPGGTEGADHGVPDGGLPTLNSRGDGVAEPGQTAGDPEHGKAVPVIFEPAA